VIGQGRQPLAENAKGGVLLPSAEESTSVMASFAREDTLPATGSITGATGPLSQSAGADPDGTERAAR